MIDPPISTTRLSKHFGSRGVLNSIDLQIPAGSIVGLVGTNGSGKTTLIKCLLGLLRKTSGSISVLGEDPWDLSAETKQRLGYVPQTVRLYPWMRVRQIVAYTASFYQNWDPRWVDILVERYELPLEQRTSTLSPGQLQKLSLVLAMAHRPELLILDEPVASLDPVARREFLRSVLELCQHEQHSILLSTHITSDIERIASHLAILKAGRIVLFDELDSIKERVKRLRIQSESTLPADFAITNALHCEVNDNRAIATLLDLNEAFRRDLEQRWKAQVVIEDLNLEEIFLEFHHD